MMDFKKYINIGIIIILLSLCFSVYYYKKENDIKDTEIQQNKEAITKLKQDYQRKDDELKRVVADVKEQSLKINDLVSKSNKYKNEVEEITNKYNSERLEKIASKKPKLLHKVFNNAIEKEVKSINELTKNKGE